MKLFTTTLAMAAMIASATLALGQTTVTTNPVGYVSVTCKANSDTIVSAPLAQAPEYVGAIAGAPSINASAATFTLSGTASPGWTANQFAALISGTPSYPTYYVKFTSGTLNGKFYTITANAASTVTFDTAGDIVSTAAAGDQFSIIKYWTLGALFPQGVQTTFAESKGTLLTTRMSELFIPDNNSKGYNLAPPFKYFVLSGTVGANLPGWKNASGFTDATNTVLYPDTFFIVRHPASLTQDTTFTCTGAVNSDRSVIPLTTGTLTTGQANFVTHQRPVGVTLAQLGLTAAEFTPSTSQLLPGRKDELLVYDNSIVTKSKVPTRRFYVDGSLSGANHWKESGAGATWMDDFVLEAGCGFVIKKAATATESTVFWTNSPNFSNQ